MIRQLWILKNLSFYNLEILKVIKNLIKGYYNRAIALSYMKKIDLAKIDFNYAIKINKNYGDAYMGLGCLLNDNQEYS